MGGAKRIRRGGWGRRGASVVAGKAAAVARKAKAASVGRPAVKVARVQRAVLALKVARAPKVVLVPKAAPPAPPKSWAAPVKAVLEAPADVPVAACSVIRKKASNAWTRTATAASAKKSMSPR